MSKKLEVIINEAIKRANVLRHEYLSLESVLLSMLDDDEVVSVLNSCGADVTKVKSELDQFLQDETNFSILSEGQVTELGEKQFVDEELRRLAAENGIEYQPEISLSLQRVIQRAAIHVQSAGKRQIKGINLLVAMFQEKESFALYTLQKQGIERFDVVKAIAHGVDEPVTAPHPEEEVEMIEGEAQVGERGKKRTALDEFSVNLNNLAKKNKIDPLIGRKEELKRIIQTLCRRRKNNPLLVGEAGVGKTAIAEGLAYAIEKDEVPDVLKDTEVFSLDMAALLAGAKFRGDFEQRLKSVINEIDKRNEKGQKTILFIDEIHTVMGAGATTGGSMDASNLLKPALSAGKLRCIGSTTHEEFRKFIEKDHAFSRRFQKVDINEPSIDDTYKILLGLKDKFEEFHGVKYSNTVLKSAVDLAEKHITDRKNPDKAIDVIDEIGARLQLLPENKKRSSVTKKDVEEIVAELARIPKVTVQSSEKEKLKGLRENLKLLIYGQDHAVEMVSDAILMSRSGLGHDHKPMASFIFAGPTGVGKTELARQLAIQLGGHMERFDMSEYMEKHTVSKLIGAPPGYVGYESGGLLTDAIKKNPHCVLLLDEIEKAHPDIFNILLQVMDHGVLTDAQGRSTDFRNVVIIMTTNAGAREMEGGTIGLASGKIENTGKRDEKIKQYFSPEFRNRLDAIIHFNKLDDAYIVQIVEKFLMQLEDKLSHKHVELEVTDAAKEWLAKTGFDPKMGARPIARIIDNKIKKPLSTEVLFGKLEKGGKVIVDIKNDDLDFIFS